MLFTLILCRFLKVFELFLLLLLAGADTSCNISNADAKHEHDKDHDGPGKVHGPCNEGYIDDLNILYHEHDNENTDDNAYDEFHFYLLAVNNSTALRFTMEKVYKKLLTLTMLIYIVI